MPPDFVLYGGTGIAVQLGHRVSEDFDFFSSLGFDPEQLMTLPGRGRAGRKPNTRELFISGMPFLIIYRILGDSIEITRILHAAQRWP